VASSAPWFIGHRQPHRMVLATQSAACTALLCPFTYSYTEYLTNNKKQQAQNKESTDKSIRTCMIGSGQLKGETWHSLGRVLRRRDLYLYEYRRHLSSGTEYGVGLTGTLVRLIAALGNDVFSFPCGIDEI
jgi:hypothetical protein